MQLVSAGDELFVVLLNGLGLLGDSLKRLGNRSGPIHAISENSEIFNDNGQFSTRKLGGLRFFSP